MMDGSLYKGITLCPPNNVLTRDPGIQDFLALTICAERVACANRHWTAFSLFKCNSSGLSDAPCGGSDEAIAWVHRALYVTAVRTWILTSKGRPRFRCMDATNLLNGFFCLFRPFLAQSWATRLGPAWPRRSEGADRSRLASLQNRAFGEPPDW